MPARSRSRRIAVEAMLLLGGLTLLAGPGTGCFSFAAETALTATDFCFVFDCTNGIFGGVVQPCGAGGTLGNEGPLFTDCPPQ